MDILFAIIILAFFYVLITILHISLWTILIVLAIVALIVYIRRNRRV